jgi:hypothetical protein
MFGWGGRPCQVLRIGAVLLEKAYLSGFDQSPIVSKRPTGILVSEVDGKVVARTDRRVIA